MTPLEALKKLCENNAIDIYDNDDKEELENIRNALKRLEAFDNLSKSMGLEEAYNKLNEQYKNNEKVLNNYANLLKTLKFYGLDFISQLAKEPDDLKCKKLKALEIIKEFIRTGFIKISFKAKQNFREDEIAYYIFVNGMQYRCKTKEEYDLLKEVLE